MATTFKEFIENDIGSKIKSMLGGNGFVFAFKLGDKIFATDEHGRLTFARIKVPDENSMDDANFTAVDLTSALDGKKIQSVFGKKDLKKIKVLNLDDVENALKKQAKTGMNIMVSLGMGDDDEPQIPQNMFKMGDDK